MNTTEKRRKKSPQDKTRKKYHKVVAYLGDKNTFMEFGWIENPSFENEIYVMVKSRHKGGGVCWEYRIDEALIMIEGLARALNKRLTGLDLERTKE